MNSTKIIDGTRLMHSVYLVNWYYKAASHDSSFTTPHSLNHMDTIKKSY